MTKHRILSVLSDSEKQFIADVFKGVCYTYVPDALAKTSGRRIFELLHVSEQGVALNIVGKRIAQCIVQDKEML